MKNSKLRRYSPIDSLYPKTVPNVIRLVYFNRPTKRSNELDPAHYPSHAKALHDSKERGHVLHIGIYVHKYKFICVGMQMYIYVYKCT